MPDSITVVAFIFGLVLLIAALLGKELKIAAVEMPALNRLQRLIFGLIGSVLVIFGLTEGQWLGWAGRLAPGATPAGEPALAGSLAQASLGNAGVPLPPGFAGNIRSAKASYGCGVLLGAARDNEDQLPVCSAMPGLPEEWIAKVQRVSIDCSTAASDRIIVEVWTGADYTGETWGYTFGCG